MMPVKHDYVHPWQPFLEDSTPILGSSEILDYLLQGQVVFVARSLGESRKERSSISDVAPADNVGVDNLST